MPPHMGGFPSEVVQDKVNWNPAKEENLIYVVQGQGLEEIP
jgi:hypothetical protein